MATERIISQEDNLEIDKFDFTEAMRPSVEMCNAFLNHCRELVKEKEKYKATAEVLLKDENPSMMSTKTEVSPTNSSGMCQLNGDYDKLNANIVSMNNLCYKIDKVLSRFWVTSDTHFGHENIIKYCNRPFLNWEDMNEKLIENWNARVKPEDVVIHCGDFFMGQLSMIDSVLPRLNGTIIWVRGNHDQSNRMRLIQEKYQDKVFIAGSQFYLRYRQWFFVFCHLPLSNEELLEQFEADNREIVWVHGHVHDKWDFYEPYKKSFNVCVDKTDYHPVNIGELDYHIQNCEEIKEKLKDGQIEYQEASKAMSEYIERPDYQTRKSRTYETGIEKDNDDSKNRENIKITQRIKMLFSYIRFRIRNRGGV